MNFIQRCLSTAHLLKAAFKPLLSGPPKLLRLALRDSHRCQLSVYRPQILVKVLPVCDHHYMYLLVDVGKHIAVAIDPLIPQLIIDAAKKERVELVAVFVTHHHHGKKAAALVQSLPKLNIPIYAGDRRTPCLSHHLCNGMEVQLGRMLITSVHTPSHTKDSYCLYVEGCYRQPCDRVLFTGDVLFQGGCGSFKEGCARHLFEFAQILRRLPHDTMIYGGHENTIANMQFAQQVEPKNALVARRLHWANLQQKVGMPSVPSTVREEMCWNPFLRTHFPAVKKFTGGQDDLHIISILRQMRDHFRPTNLQPKPKKELKVVKKSAKEIKKQKKAEKKAQKKMETKKAEMKVEPKKAPTKMEPKKSAMKVEPKKCKKAMKVEPKKAVTKVEPKKSAMKVEPKKSAAKVEPKKVEKKVEPKKSAMKVEPKKAATKVEPKKSAMKVEPKKSAAKVEPKKVEKKVEPKKAETKKPETKKPESKDDTKKKK